MKTNWCHYFIRILLDLYMFRAYRPIFRRVRTAVHTTIGSVSVPLCSRALASTQTERHRNWTNACVNSCANSPEDGAVGPKHVEIQQYTNKIEIVTSVGFHSICWKDARYKKLKICEENVYKNDCIYIFMYWVVWPSCSPVSCTKGPTISIVYLEHGGSIVHRNLVSVYYLTQCR